MILPFNRWMMGMILCLTVYFMYVTMGNVVEVTLPQKANDLGTSQLGIEVINNLVGNFWIGVLIMFGGGLLLILIAGIPGQQEETIIQR